MQTNSLTETNLWAAGFSLHEEKMSGPTAHFYVPINKIPIFKICGFGILLFMVIVITVSYKNNKTTAHELL